MSQSRNRRRLAEKAGPATAAGLDKVGQVLQKVQLMAEGLNLAHMGVMQVMQDMKQVKALAHEVARRAGMSEAEIEQIGTQALAGQGSPEATEEASAG